MNYLSTCSLSKLWSNNNRRSREEAEWRHPFEKKPAVVVNFKPSGQRKHMNLYL